MRHGVSGGSVHACSRYGIWLFAAVSAVLLISCGQQSASPAPTAAPTELPPMAVVSDEQISTATPSPTTTPIPTATHSPTPTYTPAPTSTPIPTATLIPIPTSTLTPTPTPTPTAREIAAERLAEMVPWFESPPKADYANAAEELIAIWLLDANFATSVAG